MVSQDRWSLVTGLGRLHDQCNRLRLPLGSVITIMIKQFSKVIEYDYMTKVFDYNYDYNGTILHLIIC